jgi:hypothetical protein
VLERQAIRSSQVRHGRHAARVTIHGERQRRIKLLHEKDHAGLALEVHRAHDAFRGLLIAPVPE